MTWVHRLDGSAVPDKAEIGGKAWSIARMRAMDLAVPPAFVIRTAACLAFLDTGGMPDGLDAELREGIAWLEAQTGRTFGRGERRLLLSVRSGAAISMPGMMDTVLNLGIDADGVEALAAETGLADFAEDTRRRFRELYSAIVLKGGEDVPDDAHAQLTGAVRAVFESWNTRRARRYRDHNGIPHDLGTAVTVQAMVFGNLNADSGTGVVFSRNPLTGERAPYGEYLPRAQGEDVVSGKFTPLPLDAMRERVPDAHAALLAATERLEHEHGDVQDIEFTVQSGKLYLLQSRAAKRAPAAAVRIAIDMIDDGRIDVATALARVSPDQVQTLLLPRFAVDATAGAEVIARGEGACPGVATGVLVADADEAERRAAVGEAVILARKTTSPDDLHGMIAARAIVTEQGGSTSHAAVVSRALGRPCVVGAADGIVARAGQIVTLDGAAGLVYAGELATEVPSEQDEPDLARLIGWARGLTDVSVVETGDGPDVDEVYASGDEAAFAALLRANPVVRGSALAQPAVARQAREQGVRTIVTRPVLPALLALGADR